MEILTFATSPYLQSPSALINKDLLIYLQSQGYNVSSLALDHDLSFFLPEIDGRNLFSQGNHRIPLYPFLDHISNIFTFFLDTIKVAQPKLIITIGDYKPFLFINNIRNRYKGLFKWLHIHIGQDVDSADIRELDKIDHIVCLSSSTLSILKSKLHTLISQVYYGPSELDFINLHQDRNKDLLYVVQNNGLSNIPAFAQLSTPQSTLYTNNGDKGHYSLTKYNFNKNSDYVSIKDYSSPEVLNTHYNQHRVACSVEAYSPLPLNILQGCLAGCLPLVPNFGVYRELFAPFEEFMLEGVKYEASDSEYYFIIDGIKERSKTNILLEKSRNLEWFEEKSSISMEIGKDFTKEKFLFSIKNIIENSNNFVRSIIIDSF